MTRRGAPGWGEEDTSTYVDHAAEFVPEREQQIDTLCALLPAPDGPFRVLDVCCGDGSLARAILERFPRARVVGLDGSQEMLRRALGRNAPYGERFEARTFDLAASDWRAPVEAFQAIVSSLAIHHLDGPRKRRLFEDALAMLRPGGALLLADLVAPATELGRRLAADAWDDEVRRRAADGRKDAFEAFQRTRWNHFRYPDPADVPSRLVDQLDWLARAGFEDVDVHWMKAGHAVFGGRRPVVRANGTR